MSNVHSIDPYAVGRIVTLEMHDDNTAKEMLEKVAWQVQPILRRRKYTVPLLTEMFPAQAGLLGLNIGGGGGSTQEIRIRLRPAHSPNSFMHYESILVTMLHEITHNIHGPHDAKFYKLLDELKAECEELIAKGMGGKGSGFDAPSAGKVGGRIIGRELSTFDRRQVALRAAEERAKKQGMMPKGPQKLGGDRSLLDLPAGLAAAAAAERRLRDNKWCPTEILSQEADAGHSVNEALQAILDGRFAAPQQEKPAAAVPHLPDDNRATTSAAPASIGNGANSGVKPSNGGLVPNSNAAAAAAAASRGVQIGTKRAREAAQVDNNNVIDLTVEEEEETQQKLADGASGNGGLTPFSSAPPAGAWTCPACTFINSKPLALQCEVCMTIRRTPSICTL